MNRRELVSAAGAGIISLTGCLSIAKQSKGKSNNDKSMTVSVTNVESVPKKYETALDVDLRDPNITQGHTATVRITLENRSSETRTYTAGKGLRPVFSTQSSTKSNSRIVLVTPKQSPDKPEVKDKKPCWRLSKVPQHLQLDRKVAVLDANQSTHLDLEVWGHPENDSTVCIPTGKFKFKEKYLFIGGDGEEKDFNWEFSLSVE